MTAQYLQSRYELMKAQVQRWGNSLALRIPKPLASEMQVSAGTTVELSVHAGKLTVRAERRFVLRDLLARVEARNIHGEVSTGTRRGREEW